VTVTARFVGGTGRCGTAILGAVLADHPETTYFREPRFINDPGGLADYVQGRVTLEAFQRRMVRQFRKNLVNKLETIEGPSVRDTYTPAVIEAILSETMDGQDRAEDGRRFIQALFSQIERPYWVEKTPHTVRYVHVLYQMFDRQMHYLHLIREPKDVFASLLCQGWGPKRVPAFINWYTAIMSDASIAFQQTPRQCCKVVEMEHLVANPCNVLSDIFAFFKIPAEPGWIFDVSKKVSLQEAHIGRYASELSRDAQYAIDRACGELYIWWKEWGQ